MQVRILLGGIDCSKPRLRTWTVIKTWRNDKMEMLNSLLVERYIASLVRAR